MSAPVNNGRPVEALHSGASGRWKEPRNSNEEINRAIREAIWNAPPGMTELLPEELDQDANQTIRRAARGLFGGTR